MTEADADPVELLVCVTCRRGDGPTEGAVREGAALFTALSADPPPAGVRIRAVECLQNCRGGCTIALRGRGRWTYVYGALHEADDVALLREGAARYRAAPDGLVPWRERPVHFRKNCIARVPPSETTS